MHVFIMRWRLVAAKAATDTFIPDSEWIPVRDYNYGRTEGEMRGKVNTITATPTIQYANDPRSPDGTIKIGTGINGDGMLDPESPTSLSTIAAYKYIRAGWTVVGDGTNIAVAAVAAQTKAFKA